MASVTPRLPEQFRGRSTSDYSQDDFAVSELVADAAGAHSPFGDTELPMPMSALTYVHPRPEDRPHLAGEN
jgi:hypothetical protein